MSGNPVFISVLSPGGGVQASRSKGFGLPLFWKFIDPFMSKGDITGGIKFVGGACQIIEPGGVSTTQMINNVYK